MTGHKNTATAIQAVAAFIIYWQVPAAFDIPPDWISFDSETHTAVFNKQTKAK